MTSNVGDFDEETRAARSRRAFQDVSNNGDNQTSNDNGSNNTSRKRKAANKKKQSGHRKRRALTTSDDNNTNASVQEEEEQQQPRVVTNGGERGARTATSSSALLQMPIALQNIHSNNNSLADEGDSIFQQQNSPKLNSYQYTGVTDEIDEHDKDDPLACYHYCEDIIESYREKEVIFSVRPGYMERQPELNERMRTILVDWLIEVHHKFRMVPETIYLAVNIVDRYLDIKECPQTKFQLVGSTALLIASKYEEIFPPDLRDLVYICDGAYTRQDILEMEIAILTALDYKIMVPTAHHFLLRFLKAAHADKELVRISCWVMDGTLLSTKLMRYLPSEIAAACVLIARHSIGRHGWSPTLLKYAQYKEEEVAPIARVILAEYSSFAKIHPTLRGIKDKYESARFAAIAKTAALKHDF